MSGFFMAAGAAANVAQEVPIDGQTGVWIKSGTAVISSGMSMVGAVIRAGQTQYIYDRGVIRDCIFSSGASQLVFSGGVESGTTAYYGLHCSMGGVSYDRYDRAGILANPGAELYNLGINAGLQRFTGAIVRSVTVTGGVSVRATMGAKIYDMTISGNINAGYVISSGTLISGMSGTAAAVSLPFYVSGGLSNAICESGWNFIFYNHGSAGDVTLKSGATMVLSNLGSASGVVVSEGGTLTVSSGGTALAVTSNAGATVTVLEGGYIEYVTP